MQRNRGKQQNGKTRDDFKNIRDTKGTFHAKMGSIKHRNDMGLTEAEDIKKRWQEYTAAAAMSLQSCPTLSYPIDSSPPGSPVPGELQLSYFKSWKMML